MPRQPSREYTCPDCAIAFMGRNITIDRRLGKLCPNGQFNTLTKLGRTNVKPVTAGVASKFNTANQMPMTLADVASSKVTEAERRLLDSFGTKKLPLRSFGIVGRIQELELAVQLLIDTYERLSHTVAPIPKLSGLIDGAFAANAELAKRILHK